MNVVPTQRTRDIARHMIATAAEESGADAVVRLLPKVPADQLPALVGVLLTNTKIQQRIGRPRLKDTYTEEERRRANRQYKAGMRDDWTMTGWREYQRIHQRKRTERVGRFGRT